MGDWNNNDSVHEQLQVPAEHPFAAFQLPDHHECGNEHLLGVEPARPAEVCKAWVNRMRASTWSTDSSSPFARSFRLRGVWRRFRRKWWVSCSTWANVFEITKEWFNQKNGQVQTSKLMAWNVVKLLLKIEYLLLPNKIATTIQLITQEIDLKTKGLEAISSDILILILESIDLFAKSHQINN